MSRRIYATEFRCDWPDARATITDLAALINDGLRQVVQP